MIDAQLETAIDNVGRDKVFALVKANGWKFGDAIPKFVWYEAVRMLQTTPQHKEARSD